MAGGALAPIALAFGVLQTPGLKGHLGLVLAVQSAALVVFLLLGGTIADRWRRGAVLIGANVAAGLVQVALGLGLAVWAGHLGVVLALASASGFCTAFTLPATRGILPELVESAALRSANAALSTSRNLAKVVGPAVAGGLAATIGGGPTLVIDGASYLVAALLMTPLGLGARQEAGQAVWHDLTDGFATFSRLRWAVVVVVSFGVTNAIIGAVWLTLGPLIADDSFGEAGWGDVMSVRAVGLLVMGVVMYRLTVTRMLTFGQVMASLFAVQLVALGLHAPLVVLLVASLVGGLGSAAFAITWDTALQTHVPEGHLSRVAAFDNVVSFATVPVGQVVAMPLADHVGTYRLALVGGVVYAVVALGAIAFPSVRRLEG